MIQTVENDKTSRTFDLAVIGAGSAGFSTAIGAAELGASVALIGDGTIGGTCVNIGCVPSKTLIRAAETLYHAGAASRFAGIEVEARLTDWQALIAQKDELVGSIEEAGRIVLSFEVDGRLERLSGDELLVAAGRIPNSHDLGLESAGVALGPHGGIQVDEFLRTSNEDIYAVGDVTGRDMHVYMAAYGGKWAAENALNGGAHRYDAEAMPAVTFTDPQVATVGLTEAQARGRDIEVKTAVLPLDAVPRALAARDTRGLIKLVADQATDSLICAHILAPEAGYSIQTAAIAIKAHMSAAELGATIFPYLTTVEGLKLAAQTFEKDVSKLSCCAG